MTFKTQCRHRSLRHRERRLFTLRKFIKSITLELVDFLNFRHHKLWYNRQVFLVEDVVTQKSVNCSNFYQNVKLLVQSRWDKYFQDRRGAKPKGTPVALNWAQYPNVPYVYIEKKKFFQYLTYFCTVQFKIVRKWRASKLFLKNHLVSNQISEAAITAL